jgi:HSP20 family protein
MNWKKIAPWNWFRDEERAGTRSRVAGVDAPSDPFAAFRAELDRLSAELFQHVGPDAPRIASLLRPSLDISEDGRGYTIRVELPGLELENISIDVDGQTLVLRGQKLRERVADDEGYHCAERSYGTLQRVLSLPDDADGDAIDARFKNGVLTLRIPKRELRTSQARRIEIQSA